MSYCYCTPNRSQLRPRYEVGTPYSSSAYNTAVMGTKGDWVQKSHRDAALKGWMTRRANLARKERERIEAAAKAATLTPFVIEGTVPADTIAAEPVAITTIK